MTTEPLCISCGYWTATDGDQCETCAMGMPGAGREASVIAAAIGLRRAIQAHRAAAETLVDAVDRMMSDD